MEELKARAALEAQAKIDEAKFYARINVLAAENNFLNQEVKDE